MLNEAICNHKIKIVFDKGDDRTKSIIAWLSRIEKSECTITEFFDKYNVPFSRSQYYLYKSRLKEFRGIYIPIPNIFYREIGLISGYT